MGEITIAILVVAIVILTKIIDSKEYKESKKRWERDIDCPCPQTRCFDCDREFCRWRKI